MVQVNILLLDVDGVLTDGKQTVSSRGERFKTFHTRDNRAIREFIAHGWEVHLVTTSTWSGLQHYANNLGVEIHTGITKDTATIQSIVHGKWYDAVGDDVFDIEMLLGANKAWCPRDADRRLLELTGVGMLDTSGGNGVIAELAMRYFEK